MNYERGRNLSSVEYVYAGMEGRRKRSLAYNFPIEKIVIY